MRIWKGFWICDSLHIWISFLFLFLSISFLFLSCSPLHPPTHPITLSLSLYISILSLIRRFRSLYHRFRIKIAANHRATVKFHRIHLLMIYSSLEQIISIQCILVVFFSRSLSCVCVYMCMCVCVLPLFWPKRFYVWWILIKSAI